MDAARLRLAGYVRRRVRGWAVLAALTALHGAVAIAEPWPLKIVVDHVLGGVPAPPALAGVRAVLPGAGTAGGLLAWVVAAGLLLFALGSALDVALTVGWIRIGQRLVYEVAHDLLVHLLRLSPRHHGRTTIGDAIARITGDSWSLYTVPANVVFTPALALVAAGGMVVVMLRMDRGLTLVALALAPLMAATAYLVGRPMHAAARARREIESRIQAHVQQTLVGMPVVQAFGQEERTRREFEAHAAEAVDAHRRVGLLDGLSALGTGAVAALGTAVILWLGARRVLAGGLTVGGLLLFTAYLATLHAHLQAVAAAFGAWQSGRASLGRAAELFDSRAEVTDPPDGVTLGRARGHVRFERVSFGYDADAPVLRDVSFEARPGERLAIVGPSGAGKSTLVSLVPRLLDADGGRVLVDGHDVRDVRLASLRAQIAVVFQEPFLDAASVADNIAVGRPGASRAEIEAAARVANAHDLVVALPDGYDTVLGERGATLSGGERQRIAVARAVLRDAPILVLDEPTSALDAGTEASLMEALERLMAGRTTLIVAHRLSTVRGADRIVVLDRGVVVQQGTHEALLAADGIYRRLHERGAAAAAGPR